MSISPAGTSVSSRSDTSRCRRVARWAPRRWIPTSATWPSGFFSTISCAIRTSVRRMSSPSRTTLACVIRLPSWPRWTGLKGCEQNLAALADAKARATLGDVRTQRLRAVALEVGEQPLVVLGHAIPRPARLELDHEQPQLGGDRLVGAQDPRAGRSGDEGVVDGVVRLDDGAPGRVGLLAHRGHQPYR